MAPRDDLAGRLQRVWYGGGRVPAWTRLVALVFGSLSALRRACYRAGLLRAHRASVPVVVVGNIAVGGSGKTPFTIALVGALRERGWKPGVVSRGYGRSSRQARLVDQQSYVQDVGDEPLLIARRTGVPVAVASRRVDAANLLARSSDIDVLIADDGLQHYALHRDIEIALVDGRRGLGNQLLLPAGPLREPVARLQQCDAVLGMLGTPDTLRVDGVCEGRMGEAVNLRDGSRRTITDFSGRDLHAVAGIADPQRFFDGLRESGLRMVEHAFPDHHAYVDTELAALRDATVLTTEKDAVKLAAFAGDDWWKVAWSVRLPDGFADMIDARLRRQQAGVEG